MERGEIRREPSDGEVGPTLRAQVALTVEVVNHKLRSYGECGEVWKYWERSNLNSRFEREDTDPARVTEQ